MNTPHDPPQGTPDPAAAPAAAAPVPAVAAPTAAAAPTAPRPPGPPRPPPRKPDDGRGSLGLGIGLAWASLVGGYTVVGFLMGAAMTLMPSDAAAVFAILGGLLPWVFMIALIVWFASNGQPRTAAGIGLGIASIFGVGLLLIAACFGLFAGTNFH